MWSWLYEGFIGGETRIFFYVRVGTYNLQEYNHFGCEDCECDMGGAVDHNCDKTSGACVCRPRIGGVKCDQ